ncbi:MAG: type IV secretion system protein [Rickettsia sp.]|nr:type IV secretion system protein [Rickettsia sp.]
MKRQNILIYVFFIFLSHFTSSIFASNSNQSISDIQDESKISNTCFPVYDSILIDSMLIQLTLGQKLTAQNKIRFQDSKNNLDLCAIPNRPKCEDWNQNDGTCNKISLKPFIKAKGSSDFRETLLTIENNAPKNQIQVDTKILGFIPGSANVFLSTHMDMVCTQAQFLVFSPYLGCTFMQQSDAKEVNESCVRDIKNHSQSKRPLSSIVYYCTSQMLKEIREDSLKDIREILKNFVQYSLVLYVIFIGYRIILTQEINKTSLIIEIIKMIFVTYFSIGLVGEDGKIQNGFDKYILPLVESAGSELARFINLSGKICKFPKGNDTSYEEGYAFLGFWDSIDCYLSSFLPNELFLVLIIVFLKFGSFWGMLILQYILLVLSMFTFVLEIFVRSLIVMTILSILSPIFITMYLFSFTRDYFDKFIKVNLSMILQPLVATLYIFLAIWIFEKAFYKLFGNEEGDVNFFYMFSNVFSNISDFIINFLQLSIIAYLVIKIRSNIASFVAFITGGPILVNMRNAKSSNIFDKIGLSNAKKGFDSLKKGFKNLKGFDSINRNSQKYDSVLRSSNRNSQKYDSVSRSSNRNSQKYDSVLRSSNHNLRNHDRILRSSSQNPLDTSSTLKNAYENVNTPTKNSQIDKIKDR